MKLFRCISRSKECPSKDKCIIIADSDTALPETCCYGNWSELHEVPWKDCGSLIGLLNARTAKKRKRK